MALTLMQGNPRIQETNLKQIPNHNDQNRKRDTPFLFLSLRFWSLVIVWFLYLGSWNFFRCETRVNIYLRKYPEVSTKFMKIFIGRLRHADRQIEHFALHSIKGRMARMILDWVVDLGTIKPDGVHFQFPHTHKERAGMLGTGRESVTRMLTELKEEGYLAIDKNKVCVSNIEELRELVL